MTEDERLFELAKDAAQHKGMAIILEDLEKNLQASDTTKIMPMVDSNTGAQVSLTERMLLQAGYVQALEWMKFIILHYRDNAYQGDDGAV